jgi:hypothetical protein
MADEKGPESVAFFAEGRPKHTVAEFEREVAIDRKRLNVTFGDRVPDRPRQLCAIPPLRPRSAPAITGEHP